MLLAATQAIPSAGQFAVQSAGQSAGQSELGITPSRDVTFLVTSALSGRLVDAQNRPLAEIAASLQAEAVRARSQGRQVVILDAGRTVTPYAETRHEGGTTTMVVLEAGGVQAYLPDPMDLTLGRPALERLSQSTHIPIILPFLAQPSTEDTPLALHQDIDLGDDLVVRLRSVFSSHFGPDVESAGLETGDGHLPESLGTPKTLDLVVVHSNGKDQNTVSRGLTWTLLDKPRGAEILLDPAMSHDMEVRTQVDGRPLFLVGRVRNPDERTILRIDATVAWVEDEWRVNHLDSVVLPLDRTLKADPQLTSQVRSTWQRFHDENDVALQHETPVTYQALHLYALASMREFAKAEVAIMHREGLRPVAEKFFTGERITREAVLRMLSIDQRIETIDLTGAELSALATTAARRPRPQDPLRNNSLEFFGMTYEVSKPGTAEAKISNVRVNGRPILSGDRYRVATNQFLLTGGDGYTLLAGKDRHSNQTVAPELREDIVIPRSSEESPPFTDLTSRSLWRYGLGELSILADGVETDRTQDYVDSPDSRASATDSTSIRGRLALYLDLDRGRWRWENRLKGSFGLVQIESTSNEIDDDLRLDSSFVFGHTTLLGGSPYAALGLDTEFRRSRQPDGSLSPRQLEETASAGLNWNTARWPRIRLGATLREYPNLDRDPQLGLSGQAEFLLKARDRRPGLKLSVLGEHLESDDSEVERFDLDLRLSFPLFKQLSFAPSLNYYWLEDSDFTGDASYFRLSVGLAYQWNGKHQSW